MRFANIDKNTNEVISVIIAEENYIKKLPGNWYPDYNNRAGIGRIYDSKLKDFIPKSPSNTWVFNEKQWTWVPPIPRPDDPNNDYAWNETQQTWDILERSPQRDNENV